MDGLLAARNTDPAGSGLRRRDLRGKLTLARLPMMSPILLQLLDLCERDDLNLSDLTQLINRDVGMVARIFAVSTSAAFQGRNRPATLDQCLSLLGVSTIKTIIINESVLQVFNRFADWRELDLGDFWEHSLRCALFARELALRMNYASPDEAYLGGLVHDVGRLAMLATDPDGYKRIFREYEDGEALCAVEQTVFALTHAEVGAWLVEKWALDSFLGDCVLYHHEPLESMVSAPLLVRIVLLAEHLADLRGHGQRLPDVGVLTLCGASIDDPEALLDAVEREVSCVAEQFGIQLAAQRAAEPGELAESVAAHRADLQLAARIQDLLLVNQVLNDSPQADGFEAALQGTVQALKLLFDLDAALCFARADTGGARFQARPLGFHWSRLSQLEFVLGRSASLLARSVEAGPLLILRGEGGRQVLDDQIVRAVGGEGVLLLPLGTHSSCAGVLVAGVDSAARAAALQARLTCLAYFGRMSGQRMAAKGSPDPVAHGQLNRLVHELNNPLAIIRNYIAILELENAGKGAAQPELGIVREEIDRVAKMLRTFREPPEVQAAAPGPVNLNRIIEDLAGLFRGSIPMASLVEISVDLADGLPEIVSDQDQLKQLLVNLLKNAIEAMPEGGKISVASAAWGGSPSGPSHIEIRIEDNGPGIPKEVLARLYQPVASSKAGQHRGLGLAIVGQLVRDLNGLINCRSGAEGTRFQVLLPLQNKRG
jgi:HD-like signal output (HDOD) protein/signal transduction histidine kinase